MNKVFSKKLMLAAGILAVLVILCSRAFQEEANSFLSKSPVESAEKTAQQDQKIIIAAPSDAVTSSAAVEVAQADPSFIREILFGEGNEISKSPVSLTILSDFLRTLFSVIISPQAP